MRLIFYYNNNWQQMFGCKLTKDFQRVSDINWVSQHWYLAEIISSIRLLDLSDLKVVVIDQPHPWVWSDHHVLGCQHLLPFLPVHHIVTWKCQVFFIFGESNLDTCFIKSPFSWRRGQGKKASSEKPLCSFI